ncbi:MULTISPECIES: hypothetical protein [unclassified Sphingobium]|uniref:hypothetical protein n=1 Tax=unclassified Sphingobium TaxID=2611147 RepID=UPI00343DCE6E
MTVFAPGEAKLPRRPAGSAQDREAQLVALLQLLTGEGAALDALAFRKGLEARAPASIKALAVDCDCYARFSAKQGGIGLPASEARLVAYVDYCEARRLKPATVSRRLSSLAVAHQLLGVASPVGGAVVRDALRGHRRRVGVRQRQAGPLRFGEGIGREAVKGFTLSVLLEACGGDVVGLRDAALLSLGYDAGLRVSELAAVELDRIELQEALAEAIDALSTHSLRVGLTQDLFASGEDAGPIAQALRWTSTATALRYGRKLAPSANAAARMLKGVRK